MTFLWLILGFLLVCALVFWRLLATAARWGREMVELTDHGVTTTGTVVRKVRESGRHGASSRAVKYEYVDPMGARHWRKVLVTDEAWDTLSEGGPIEIVYSARHPGISAPAYLLDVMKKTPPGP